MPIVFDCPCGKRLRLREELATLRVRCPECGDAVDVPELSEVDESSSGAVGSDGEPPEDPRIAVRSELLAGDESGPLLNGKPVLFFAGLLVPSYFGTSSLALGQMRLVESIQRLLFERHRAVRLSAVDAVEVLEIRNLWYLLLGLILLPVLVGVLFLILFVVKRYRLLVVRANSVRIGIVVEESEDVLLGFANAVMAPDVG